MGKFQRNVMPVKEYGILFEYCGTDENEKKSTRTSYWIVGYVFVSVTPRKCARQIGCMFNLISVPFIADERSVGHKWEKCTCATKTERLRIWLKLHLDWPFLRE